MCQTPYKGRTDGLSVRTSVRLIDGVLNERTDGRTDGRTDASLLLSVRSFVRLSLCPLCRQGRPSYGRTNRDAS